MDAHSRAMNPTPELMLSVMKSCRVLILYKVNSHWSGLGLYSIDVESVVPISGQFYLGRCKSGEISTACKDLFGWNSQIKVNRMQFLDL